MWLNRSVIKLRVNWRRRSTPRPWAVEGSNAMASHAFPLRAPCGPRKKRRGGEWVNISEGRSRMFFPNGAFFFSGEPCSRPRDTAKRFLEPSRLLQLATRFRCSNDTVAPIPSSAQGSHGLLAARRVVDADTFESAIERSSRCLRSHM